MAQKIAVILTCDLDEEEVEAAGTVTFGYEGSKYAFELCQEHRDEFDELMQSYIAAARTDGTRAKRASTTRRGARRAPVADEATSIREWARANGHKVSDRGRVSRQVREAYEAAHSRKR